MNNILNAKRNELKTLEAEIAEKEREIRNYSHEVTEDDYDAFLDEIYEDVDICGSVFSPSYALKNLDRTAYDTGKSDHESSIDLDDVPEYKELTEELEDLESRRDDLESEIEDLEEAEENDE